VIYLSSIVYPFAICTAFSLASFVEKATKHLRVNGCNVIDKILPYYRKKRRASSSVSVIGIFKTSISKDSTLLVDDLLFIRRDLARSKLLLLLTFLTILRSF
jgi:hypothetical protein